MTALLAIPAALSAQSNRQEQVISSYIPDYEEALAIRPDSTDTSTVRPVESLKVHSLLTLQPFRPAQTGNWNFDSPQPGYLKAGIGCPLNSQLDLFATSHNADRGYVVGWVNHRGYYNDLKNMYGQKRDARELNNSVGTAAGLYLGRHALEAMLTYDHRDLQYYGAGESKPWLALGNSANSATSRFHDLNADLRIGDDFSDLSRTNFEIELHGGIFYDRSDCYDTNIPRYSENNIGGTARIARAYGRSYFDIKLMHDYVFSNVTENPYSDPAFDHHFFRMRANYGHRGKRSHFEIGFHAGLSSSTVILAPHLHWEFDGISRAAIPFLSVDGECCPLSCRELTYENPFLAHDMWQHEICAERIYTARLGVKGSSADRRFDYRVTLSYHLCLDYRYWELSDSGILHPGENIESVTITCPGYLDMTSDRLDYITLDFDATYRPSERLRFDFHGSGNYHDMIGHGLYCYDEPYYKTGLPNWEAAVGAHYESPKFSCGIKAAIMGDRQWLIQSIPGGESYTRHWAEEPLESTFTAPTKVDLQADLAWRVAPKCTLYLEGRNLLNSRLYRFVGYRTRGITCTAGVQLAF